MNKMNRCIMTIMTMRIVNPWIKLAGRLNCDDVFKFKIDINNIQGSFCLILLCLDLCALSAYLSLLSAGLLE